jgi:hypothetical protein
MFTSTFSCKIAPFQVRCKQRNRCLFVFRQASNGSGEYISPLIPSTITNYRFRKLFFPRRCPTLTVAMTLWLPHNITQALSPLSTSLSHLSIDHEVAKPSCDIEVQCHYLSDKNYKVCSYLTAFLLGILLHYISNRPILSLKHIILARLVEYQFKHFHSRNLSIPKFDCLSRCFADMSIADRAKTMRYQLEFSQSLVYSCGVIPIEKHLSISNIFIAPGMLVKKLKSLQVKLRILN